MTERKLPVVQTAGLCKTFRDFWLRPKVEAVKDLNMEIRPGQVFGLLGPNGSGKTTTIKMLLGLLYPTKGRISLFGKAPTDVSVKSRIGFLPEESYLYRFLVAHETLDYFGSLFRLPGRIRKERAERLLDMVGLKHEAKRPVGEYSKGMARRIGLAQALINDPEFLILDEPTSGLDPIGARQIKDVIRDLGRKGKTILLSSHMLGDVEDVCDRVAILYGGREMQSGTIDELLRVEDRTQITMPRISDSTLDQIRNLLTDKEKKELLEVSHPRQKLESLFLQIVEQAQKKNIQTSGARAAGAVPEFLKKATQETTDEFVSSLVEASAKPAPVFEQQPVAAVTPANGVSEEVLSHLMEPEQSGADTESSEPESPADVSAPAADEKTDEESSPTIDADAGVMDALLGGGDSESDSKEKPS
ncbi:MAG: ABC transporter ATP-binding protein [Planctomycetota bacterium]|jgi:ABC-2 type transport system ATP-binding protein